MSIEPRLRLLALADVTEVHAKNQSYGESWCRRGGQQAFAVIWRKVDRIEAILKQMGNGFDIFEAWDKNPGDIRDDIRDLRRYLLLLEEYASRDPLTFNAQIHDQQTTSLSPAYTTVSDECTCHNVESFMEWECPIHSAERRELFIRHGIFCSCQNPASMYDYDCPIHGAPEFRHKQSLTEEDQCLAEQAQAMHDAEG